MYIEKRGERESVCDGGRAGGGKSIFGRVKAGFRVFRFRVLLDKKNRDVTEGRKGKRR